MKVRTLDAQMWLPLPLDQVFAFFCEASNLDAITPPWVDFHVVTPKPIVLQAGAQIDYRLRIHLVPIRWRSEITVWRPPFEFVDEQRRGPYKLWMHRHLFAEKDCGTLVIDHVDYLPRGWLCERIINRWLVAPDLCTIFAYRQKRIRELLAPQSIGGDDKIVVGAGEVASA